MAQITDYGIFIQSIYKGLEAKAKTADWKNDELLIEIFSDYRDCIRAQIHDILVPLGTKESEKEIREILRKYVIGYIDKKKKIVYQGALDWISSKLAQIEKENKKIKRITADQKEYAKRRFEIEDRYKELKDDFMALASFRSFKHYCLYLEEVYAPEDKKIWVHAEKHGIADGMWYGLGSMFLRGDIKTMFKQTPTGYFKTYSNICFISWLFGNDINADVMYILGNPTMVKKVFVGIKQQMCRDRFGKIFPYYKQFDCNEDKMFEINNLKEGELLITGANSMCNFKIASKDTAIDGVRFKWRFYDDVTRSMDKNNAQKHAKDNELYHDDWTKRRYTEFEDFEIFSGTAYSPYDLINTQKDNKGVDKSEPCQFKYCTINKQTATMFVKIPKLDPITDKSTLPEKYTTAMAHRERERDAETFFAMEQQEPLPPSGLPFDYKKLKTYITLPEKAKDGGERSNVCKAVLDPARTGNDNLSLGVHSKCGDYEYLVSCFYKKTPLDGRMADGRTALEHCCDMIIDKNVVELLVEINTVSNIKSQIEDILHSRGYRSCVIKTKYSTQKKSDKIFDNQSTILEYIVFPHKSLYGASSMMGQYMKNIVTWHAKTKDNDDSIDTEAMFCDEFVRGNKVRNGSVEVLRL